MRAWEMVISKYHVGDVVKGKVTRKIKGGLLVDIGVNVFLPASQVDIRRPADIGDYIGRTIQCIVLKIDDARRNIVVSRRALIETRGQVTYLEHERDELEALLKRSDATPLPSFLANGIQLHIASSTQVACGTESTIPAFCATTEG
jgi:transcriptional accessory protein Tex/SPT6